ncbi:hypothetical protein GH975_07025 [Litorivicinus lipolyticus]|uniref:Trypsin n=1 Tax=Litorivicinus lipolyticus TaxID=418701 RepID=A0A5Q2QB80_9GAMM|nr:hypothetical protein [Litorivicinus lipolyticus]QGG80334.1 hypothetical protein GH975_07025 [Litorivicinus lipolyticus]
MNPNEPLLCILLALALPATLAEAGAGRQIVGLTERLQNAQMSSIGTLVGQTPKGSWVGGAAVIAQTDCHLAVSTAGHNIYDGQGHPTTSIEKMHIRLGALRLPVVRAVTDPATRSTTAPENDWAVVIAEKPRCGIQFTTLDPRPIKQSQLPASGLRVQMICFHHDSRRLKDSLATESCRMYPTGQHFNGLYRSKHKQPVGLHSCKADLGTSGCPLVVSNGSQLQFVGTQIEAHPSTGAGVARLFADAYERGFKIAMRAMEAVEQHQAPHLAQR